MANSSIQTICVGLCTAGRPQMLQNCLSSLLRQTGIDACKVHFVIADNNPSPAAAGIVEAFAAACAFPVRYIHEPEPGIPIARNRLLEAALDLNADWIAFLDDDETAAPDWLGTLMRAAQTYGADAVQGRVEKRFPQPAPFWAVLKEDKRKEGQSVETCPTSNVIFSSWLIEPDGLNLRFDERLRYTGGSDTAFFYIAHEEGARIVYAHDPVVYEDVPLSRLTYAWQLSRSYRVGGNKVYRVRMRHGLRKAAAEFSPEIILQFARGGLQLLSAPFLFPFGVKRFKRAARQGGGSISSAAGKIAALFSSYAEPYRRIDGF